MNAIMLIYLHTVYGFFCTTVAEFTKAKWFTKPKIFAIWSFTEKDPCSKGMNLKVGFVPLVKETIGCGTYKNKSP